MSRTPKWLQKVMLEEPSRTIDEASRDSLGETCSPYCMGYCTSGYWQGNACGAKAMHRIGAEVACGAHVPQSIARQKHLTGVEHRIERLEP